MHKRQALLNLMYEAQRGPKTSKTATIRVCRSLAALGFTGDDARRVLQYLCLCDTAGNADPKEAQDAVDKLIGD